MIKNNKIIIKTLYFKTNRSDYNEKVEADEIDEWSARGAIGRVDYWDGVDFDVIQDMLYHHETSDKPTGGNQRTTNRTNYDFR